MPIVLWELCAVHAVSVRDWAGQWWEALMHADTELITAHHSCGHSSSQQAVKAHQSLASAALSQRSHRPVYSVVLMGLTIADACQ